MRGATREDPWRRRLGQLVVATLLGLGLILTAGCGEEDPCATKVCDFGVCDSSSGQCTNPDSCRVDAECLAGYNCGDGNVCVAQETCSSDEDCSAGICDGSACVNPSDCTANSDCVPGTYCADGGTCEPDPCNNVTCQRGVCERGSDDCVSADSCTQDNENFRCVAGEKCADGQCQPMESFCETLSCDRGVCSFSEGGCANASDCSGEDAQCLEGFFCNDMNSCAPNLCVQNAVNCGGDGVCQPSTGRCENAESCQSSEDCTDGHLCVEGSCRLESTACGDAGGDGGCPGNQTCQYNPAELTAVCQEAVPCETSLDCKQGRQCGGNTCLEPTSCRADRFEPNDMQADATALLDSATDGQVEGTLCSGDTDRYTFTSTDLVAPTAEGQIVVDVTVPARDIGLGQMQMSMIGPDGNQVAMESMDMYPEDGSLRMTAPVTVPTHGEFEIVLSPGNTLSSAGLRYELSVSIVDDSALNACQDAQEIAVGQRVTGVEEGAPTSAFGSNCLSDDEQNLERIYKLNVEEAQEVTVVAEPLLSDGDVTVALRNRCLEQATELACADDGGQGATEQISDVLSAGTYYVFVQAPAQRSLGRFDLNVEGGYLTRCGPNDSYCEDAQTAQLCSGDGGQFISVSCVNSCQPSTGRCLPPSGNRCIDAPVITPPSEMDGDGNGGGNGPQVKEIDLLQYENNYQIEPGGCINSEDPRTGGPEKVFQVDLPAKTSVTVDVSYTNEVKGSVYVADSCSDLEDSCIKGAEDSVDDSSSEETITYSNLTNQAETRYVVVDTADGEKVQDAEASFSFKDVICSPQMERCSSSENVEICNEFGTAYTQTDNCRNFGCASATCQRPDTCNDAINVTQDANTSGGVTYTGLWGNFTNDYEGDACTNGTLSSIDTDGRESVYRADLKAGEQLLASLTTPGDHSMYIKTSADCGTNNTACYDFYEADPFGSTVTRSVEYIADSDETVYLFVEREDDPGSDQFTVDIEINQPTCTPPAASCTSGGDVNLCKNKGFTQQTVTCSNCCTDADAIGGSPNVAIPDGDFSGIDQTGTISCAGTVSKVFVGVQIDHVFRGDVKIDLTSPAGTTVTVKNDNFNSSPDIRGIYPLSLTPDNALSIFQGEDPNGTWTLNVADTLGLFTGDLESWNVWVSCN